MAISGPKSEETSGPVLSDDVSRHNVPLRQGDDPSEPFLTNIASCQRGNISSAQGNALQIKPNGLKDPFNRSGVGVWPSQVCAMVA